MVETDRAALDPCGHVLGRPSRVQGGPGLQRQVAADPGCVECGVIRVEVRATVVQRETLAEVLDASA